MDWYDFSKEDIDDRDIEKEVQARRHVFVPKLRRRAGAGGGISSAGVSDFSVDVCGAMLSAADFADASNLPLDTLVTIDFARLGIHCVKDAERELKRFIKCYMARADSQRHPCGWIYAIEANKTNDGVGFHAHIALHVPGIPRGWKDRRFGRDRTEFRKWARDFVTRKMNGPVPRVVRISCSLQESSLRHWNAVTYLMKGHDRMALVQSERSSPDGLPVYLRDLMPWRYCDPGFVDLPKRYGISHNLGPKQRQFGAPPRLEQNLPDKPNFAAWNPIEWSRRVNWDQGTIVRVAQPFRTIWEDGVRDVRKLYPPEFYRYVSKQEPYEAVQPVLVHTDCLTCQLRALAGD